MKKVTSVVLAMIMVVFCGIEAFAMPEQEGTPALETEESTAPQLGEALPSDDEQEEFVSAVPEQVEEIPDALKQKIDSAETLEYGNDLYAEQGNQDYLTALPETGENDFSTLNTILYEIEPNDTRETAQRIEDSVGVLGVANNSREHFDDDWYAIELDVGGYFATALTLTPCARKMYVTESGSYFYNDWHLALYTSDGDYKGGLNAVSSASSVRSNVIYLSAGTYYVNVFNLGLDRMDYGFINTFNGVGLASAGIYLAQYGGDTVVAGLVANKHAPKNLTYRWQVYSYETQSWYLLSDWNTSEWVNWQPGKTGAYLLYGEIKDLNGNTVQACIGYNHKEASITGICQMPNPYGPGFMLGVSSNVNPNNELYYELSILDCTLYAQGKPAWIWTTGKNRIDGNTFWAVWQPKYGYYWTYFRVYSKDGRLLDDKCFGFSNI